MGEVVGGGSRQRLRLSSRLFSGNLGLSTINQMEAMPREAGKKNSIGPGHERQLDGEIISHLPGDMKPTYSSS